MPTVLSYPGVYIEEIPSGVRTITGVATSRTAFVGKTLKGPVNEPVIINNYADFERIFGGLWYESTLSYAVRDFYLNGGSQAVIVRLFNPIFPDDASRLEALNKATDAAKNAATAVASQARNAATATATGDDVATITEKSIGTTTSSEINKIPPGTSTETENAIKYAVTAAATAVARAARNTVSSPDSVASAAEKVANAVTVSVPAMRAAKAVAAAARSAVSANARAEDVRDQAKKVNDTYVKDFEKADDADKAAKDVASKAREAVTAYPGEVLEHAEDAMKSWDKNGNPQCVRDAAVAVYNAVKQAHDNNLDDNSMAKAAEDLEKSVYLKAVEDAQSARDAATTVFNAANEATHNADYVAAAAENAGITAPTDAAAKEVPIPKARIMVDNLVFEAANEGSWGNNLRVNVDYKGAKDVANRLHVDENFVFNLTIRDASTGAMERLIGVTTAAQPETSRKLDKVLINESRMVRLLSSLDPSPTRPGAKEEYGKLQNERIDASDGKDLDGTDFTSGDGKKGIRALDKIDLFNMLCLPPITRDIDMPSAVYQDAQTYCIDRRAILILDSPKNWSASNAVEKLAKLNLFTDGRNAALYFPWLLMPDPLREGQLDYFAPCGAIAGIIARTDAKRGVWKAPAGLDASINGISGLQQDLTDSEDGILNPQGINCLRNFRSNGIVIWGARTLRGADQFADEWKYLPVRRLALYIEESLYRGTQWIVFEPNDEPLWAQIRLNIGAFMHNLFRQGAFKGSTPRDAYFVKCDKETTNSTDINNGVVNIIVGFAPLKPAEFVVIKLQQMAGQIEV